MTTATAFAFVGESGLRTWMRSRRAGSIVPSRMRWPIGSDGQSEADCTSGATPPARRGFPQGAITTAVTAAHRAVGGRWTLVHSVLCCGRKNLRRNRLANGFAGWVACAACSDAEQHAGRRTFVHSSGADGRRNSMRLWLARRCVPDITGSSSEGDFPKPRK